MSASAQIGGQRKNLLERLDFKTYARRTRYAVSQGARVAIYTAHSELMRRITKQMQADLPDLPSVTPVGPVPSQRRMLSDIYKLFAEDLRAVEEGYYPFPSDGKMTLHTFLKTSRRFFKDVPEVARRRATGAHQEVNTAETALHSTQLPRYYRQNFHFQTDGWLSEESARLYDFQVDVLFSGATAAMRRRALIPFAQMVRQTDQRHIKYADIACGTGGLLGPALNAFPRLKGIGVDLSEPYLSVAKERNQSNRACFVTGMAENLPFANGSLDVISCVYLFHELPPKVRRLVFSEIARALKPGGLFLFVDSLQTGDVPDYDGLLSIFPQLFHEPYFGSYLTEDLEQAARDVGLEPNWTTPAFVSKAISFVKIK